MHCVSVFYPNRPGSTFDLQYYLNSHMPLGFDLLHRNFGVIPSRIEVLAHSFSLEDPSATGAFHCICNIYFETREDADGFRKLLGLNDVVELLSAEWPRYASGAEPIAMASRLIELDPKDVLARAK